jgi:hypothetical protein
VPGNHPLLGALQFSSFLGGDRWSAPAGVCHSRYSRWIFRTETEISRYISYGIRTARP